MEENCQTRVQNNNLSKTNKNNEGNAIPNNINNYKDKETPLKSRDQNRDFKNKMETKNNVSNSCSKIKSISKISELNQLKETSTFGKIDSQREHTTEPNKMELNKIEIKKQRKNDVIPFKIENLNPLKYNSPNGLIEINQNKNLIVFIKARNM